MNSPSTNDVHDQPEDKVVTLRTSVGSHIVEAIAVAIEFASAYDCNSNTSTTVVFEFNGVTIQVKRDSMAELIYRDWDRVIDGCIQGPVGPYPAPSLSDEDKANDRRAREERKRESNARHAAWVADEMADIQYLDPPPSDTLVKYAPVSGIDLITPDHFDRLPKGTMLICLHGGACKRKGVDYIDSDTRGGFMAYGFPTRSSDNLVYEGPFRTE